jgi:D-alanyl-D-alanine-carboxypeptidase/D-alanyl-D-alanine-endopeptidase
MLGVDFLPPEDLIHLICSETAKANPDEAIDCFRANVTNYPMSYNAHNALAKIYASKGMKQQAIKSYQRSLELKPGNPEGIKGLRELGEH